MTATGRFVRRENASPCFPTSVYSTYRVVRVRPKPR